jgi:hypothetical protein
VQLCFYVWTPTALAVLPVLSDCMPWSSHHFFRSHWCVHTDSSFWPFISSSQRYNLRSWGSFWKTHLCYQADHDISLSSSLPNSDLGLNNLALNLDSFYLKDGVLMVLLIQEFCTDKWNKHVDLLVENLPQTEFSIHVLDHFYNN